MTSNLVLQPPVDTCHVDGKQQTGQCRQHNDGRTTRRRSDESRGELTPPSRCHFQALRETSAGFSRDGGSDHTLGERRRTSADAQERAGDGNRTRASLGGGGGALANDGEQHAQVARRRSRRRPHGRTAATADERCIVRCRPCRRDRRTRSVSPAGGGVWWMLPDDYRPARLLAPGDHGTASHVARRRRRPGSTTSGSSLPSSSSGWPRAERQCPRWSNIGANGVASKKTRTAEIFPSRT